MIPLYGSTGSLFSRLGKIGKTIKQQDSYLAAQFTNLVDGSQGIVSQYQGEPDLEAEVADNYLTMLTSVDTAMQGVLQKLAADTCNRMVFRDQPQPGQTLTSGNILTSLNYIIQQMRLQGAAVLAQTVTATPGSFSGNGLGAVVASTKRPFDGLVLENSFAESILITCVNDSYSGSAIAGNENFTAAGQGAEPDLMAYDWPQGSGASIGLQAINGNASNAQGNLLTNSGFANWTGNAPNNFAINLGASQIFRETGIVLDPGGSALRILGDGTTLTSFQQRFGSSAGTPGTLLPQAQYAVNLWLRRDGTAPNAGVLTVDLVDGNGVVVQDAAGNANSFAIDLTQLTTVYAPYGGAFRTPAILPSQVNLRPRLSTALQSGRSIYLDTLAMGLMGQMYTSGPFLALFSGYPAFLLGDSVRVAVTNSRGSGGTLATWQTCLARLLPVVLSSEFLFPSSNVPSVSDTLISG
jgi:hypothetical protein